MNCNYLNHTQQQISELQQSIWHRKHHCPAVLVHGVHSMPHLYYRSWSTVTHQSTNDLLDLMHRVLIHRLYSAVHAYFSKTYCHFPFCLCHNCKLHRIYFWTTYWFLLKYLHKITLKASSTFHLNMSQKYHAICNSWGGGIKIYATRGASNTKKL